MSDEELAELAALRQRAYGPDADIDGDVAARTRLAALEARARAEHPAPAFGAATRVVVPLDDRRRSGVGETDFADPFPSDAPAPPTPRRVHGEDVRAPRRRRRAVLFAVAGAVVLIVAALVWPRGAAPAPHRSPSPTSAADVECGSGWGATAAGRLRPPKAADVVWSAQWDAATVTAPDILATDQTEWLAELTPVYVPRGVAPVVQVIGPSRARIVTFRESTRSAQGFSSSAYATTDAMVASARSTVPLPACPAPDTYPMLVISPDRTCVHLQVTIAEGRTYPATVAVGGACGRT